MAGVTVTTSGPRAESGTRRNISQRLNTLADSVHGARGRLHFDIRQVLLVGGAVCIGIGFMAIVFGWYGAAHSVYLFQEIPYLISGGLLGVALVAGGGFLFFAAWIVRLLDENRRHAARVERTLDRVDRVLAAVATDAAAAAAFPATATNGVDVESTTTPAAAGGTTPSGGRFE
jgi:hypothetical protein